MLQTTEIASGVPPESPMSGRSSGTSKKLLRAAGLVLALALLAYYVDWGEFRAILAGAALPLVLMTLVIHTLDTVVMAVKWRWLLQAFQVNVSVWVTLGAYFRGRVFTLIVPSILGIDSYRAFSIWRRGHAMGPVASSILVERTLGALSSLMFLAALLPWAVQVISVPHPEIVGSLGLLAFFAGLVLMYSALGNIDRLPSTLALPMAPAKVNRALTQFLAAVRATKNQRPRIYAYFLASILEKAAYGFVVYYAAGAVGVELRLIDVVSTATVVALLERLPISFAALGVREGLIVGLFHLLGISATEAVATGVLLRAVEMTVTVASGLLWFMGREAVDSKAIAKVESEMRQHAPAPRLQTEEEPS